MMQAMFYQPKLTTTAIIEIIITQFYALPIMLFIFILVFRRHVLTTNVLGQGNN